MNINKGQIIVLFVLTVFFVNCSPTYGIDYDGSTRLSLKGITGVDTLIRFMILNIDDPQKIGLSENLIKTDVELKLRLAGIDIKPIYGPRLIAEIFPISYFKTPPQNEPQRYAFTINIRLVQSANLTRDQKIGVRASTWSTGRFGTGLTQEEMLTEIRNAVKDIMNDFINDYLSVNPKEGK